MDFSFKHTDDSYISLHDCYTNKIELIQSKISFYFENGFWILPEHSNSNLEYTARTDLSKVDFLFKKDFFDEFSVWVFRKNIFGKTVREIWDIQKLVELVNNKSFSLEFLYQYKNPIVQLYECYLHFDKKPSHLECQIRIPATETVYCWNRLCPHKKW